MVVIHCFQPLSIDQITRINFLSVGAVSTTNCLNYVTLTIWVLSLYFTVNIWHLEYKLSSPGIISNLIKQVKSNYIKVQHWGDESKRIH